MFTRNWMRLTVVASALFIFAGAGATAVHAQGFTVDYRLTKGKTMHFHDAKKADLHFKTVKSLGCEAKKHAHGNHIDVTYRCANWRRITLRSDASAHAWERWLRAAGFETRHEH